MRPEPVVRYPAGLARGLPPGPSKENRVRSLPAFLALGLLLATSGPAGAAMPEVLSVQGRLVDSVGSPITDPTTMTLRLYTDAGGATAIATETKVVVLDGEGVFSAPFGDVVDLDPADFGQGLWVGVTVDEAGGGSELAPRLPLRAAPYAMRAGIAETVVDPGLSAGFGMDLTSGVLSVTNEFQQRVSAFCPSGQAIKGIGVTGLVSCEVDDDTLYTAGFGLTLASEEFAVDTAVIQARLSAPCSPGQFLQGIGVDGSPACGVDLDTDTTYTAGSGLELQGTTFSVDETQIQKRVTGTCIPGDFIRSIDSDGEVACFGDIDTTYTAGDGLELLGTTFELDTDYAQRRVVGTCPAGQSIRTIAADGQVVCEVDTDTDTTYTAGSGLELQGTEFSRVSPGNVLVVAKSDGDFTSIQLALNTITDAAEDNPYLVRVGPGLFQGGFNLKSWVTVVGSGRRSTIVSHTGANTTGLAPTVDLADDAEIRSMTIVSDGGGSMVHTRAIFGLDTANCRVKDVRAIARGATADNNEIAVRITGTTTGVVFEGVTLEGHRGLYVVEPAAVTIVDSEILADAHAIYQDNPGDPSNISVVEVIRTRLRGSITYSNGTFANETRCFGSFTDSFVAIDDGIWSTTGSPTSPCGT